MARRRARPRGAALLFEAARCDYAIFSQPGLAPASGTANASEGLRRMQALVRDLVGVRLGADGFLSGSTGGRAARAGTAAFKCTRVGRRNGAPMRAEVDALLREGRLTSLSELSAQAPP